MVDVYVCVGSSCHLKGAYQIIKVFEELIKLNKLQDRVELKASFCLGHCTKGVSVKVGDEFLEGVTISNVNEMFEEHIVRRVQNEDNSI